MRVYNSEFHCFGGGWRGGELHPKSPKQESSIDYLMVHWWLLLRPTLD
jgi:hypothetical protein